MDYSVGRTLLDKFWADLFLLINLVLVVLRDSGSWLLVPRLYRCVTYFVAVLKGGKKAFKNAG